MNLQVKDNKFFYRSIWISDTHIGTKHCQADSLIQFLNCTDSEYLYLVGDIVDIWAMKKNIFWPRQHSEILQLIQAKADNGTKVIFTPGNHDSALHVFSGKCIGNIQVESTAIHKTSDGRSLLVLHGDQVDPLMQTHVGYWLNLFGDVGYDFILYFNHHLGRLQRLLGMKYWSLASFIKNNLKNALKHITTYENLLVGLAKENNVDGVICGHIHYPRMNENNAINYYNTGDWVENCAALTETESGAINLIYWADLEDKLKRSETESIAA